MMEWNDTIRTVLDGIGVFFLIYLIGYSTFLFLSVVIGSASLYKKRQEEKLKNALNDDYYVPISVIVPAFNEEVTVTETVKSLLALEYRCYEIVVVNDGSSDETEKVLREAFHMVEVRRPIALRLPCQPEERVFESLATKVPLTLITKRNGGKADSLNMGINAAKYPYFICMDADSVLQYDSLKKIARVVLEDDHVVAVGGVVRPSNGVKLERGHLVKYRMPSSLLACMQVLEYDRSFLASRILLDKFNGSLIISGAFGLFKKDIVVAAGGYDSSTMGEDMELVVKMHSYCVGNNLPYRIRYADDAVCWSQTPERLRDLCRQRKRWHIGLFQSMMYHRDMFVNLKYGAVSFISYFYFLIYELFSPLIEVFGLLTIVVALALDLLNVPFMLLFFGIYALFGCILTLTAFFARIYTAEMKISFWDAIKAVGLCLFELIGLRFILAFVRTSSLIGYRKKKQKWGKIERRKINYE